MRRQVEPGSAGALIIAEEVALWARVSSFLRHAAPQRADADPASHEAALIELRDAIAEAKPEDVASLTEQMMRVSAVAAGRRGKVAAPVDSQAPYFGHLRIAAPGKPPRDVLIGRRGLIDRTAAIHIVDWRDAPVSQIYYRYDEGDDYEERISGGTLQGEVLVRRNVTISGGRLRRIGCPQGTFLCDEGGQWWELTAQALPALRGGQGAAVRAGQGLGRAPRLGDLGDRESFAERVDKHLPEIAALIDPEQFALISSPESGLVVIQGGAGSGKTTVALHRVAYLAFRDPQRFRPRKMLVLVPSEALSRYVSGVLPALGVPGVPVQTCATWLRTHRKRLLPRLPDKRNESTPATVSRLKKHPAMLRLIDEYVADQTRELGALLSTSLSGLEAQGAPLLREHLIKEWERGADRPLRPRCGALKQALRHPALKGVRHDLMLRAEDTVRRMSRRAHDVGRDFAELCTDLPRLRGLLSPAGARRQGDEAPEPVTEADLQELYAWCKAQQQEVEALSGEQDEERYQAVDGRPLEEDDHPAGRLDLEDDPILLRLYQRKHGNLDGVGEKGGAGPRYEHLVLDEAQDLSVLEVQVLLDCVNRPRGPGGEPSVTIAGDVAQRLIFDNGFRGWAGLLAAVGFGQAPIHRLHLLYRSTAEVMQLAREVLGPLATAESEQRAVRSGAPVQGFAFTELGEAVAFLADGLRSLMAREPTASVALIARYSGTADLFYQVLRRSEIPALRRVMRHEFPFTPGIDLTDVTQVKGLEFDYVVLLDGTEASYPDTVESRHLLHIALTRCAHQLWLIAASARSPLLPERYFAPT